MTARGPDRYYPSIDFVLTQAQYPLRLPAYRVSHRLRYHPYPRYASTDSLMTTVDYRYSEPYSATGSSLPSIAEEDMAMLNLDRAISGGQFKPRARCLSSLVIELAFAIRQKLAFINAQPTERVVDAENEN